MHLPGLYVGAGQASSCGSMLVMNQCLPSCTNHWKAQQARHVAEALWTTWTKHQVPTSMASMAGMTRINGEHGTPTRWGGDWRCKACYCPTQAIRGYSPPSLPENAKRAPAGMGGHEKGSVLLDKTRRSKKPGNNTKQPTCPLKRYHTGGGWESHQSTL